MLSRCVDHYCMAALSLTGKHYMYVTDIGASVQLHRETAQRLYMSPSIAFTPLQTSAQNYSTVFHTLVQRLQLILFILHCFSRSLGLQRCSSGVSTDLHVYINKLDAGLAFLQHCERRPLQTHLSCPACIPWVISFWNFLA